MKRGLVLIFLMNMVCYKPIRKVLLDRKSKVDGLEGSIDTLSEDCHGPSRRRSSSP